MGDFFLIFFCGEDDWVWGWGWSWNEQRQWIYYISMGDNGWRGLLTFMVQPGYLKFSDVRKNVCSKERGSRLTCML